jgi:hypothetical protein
VERREEQAMGSQIEIGTLNGSRETIFFKNAYR